MENKAGILSNNALKVIACISMFCDHFGFLICPNVHLFRLLGRIAFPLFAFSIAEGCYYTKNRLKRFLTIFILGLIMQVFLFLFTHMVDLNIFLVFSCSICLIYLFDYLEKQIKEKKILKSALTSLLFICLIIVFFIFTHKTRLMYLNYNFYGIISPLIIYILKKYTKDNYLGLTFLAFCIMIPIHTIYVGNVYLLYAILGAFLILLYNNKRGKLNLKYLFYAFYPVHFVLIYGLKLLLNLK